MRQMDNVAKHGSMKVARTVRDPKTGQVVTVRGVGALKGQLHLKKGVDLTKPIASQALKGVKPSVAHKR